MEYRFINYFFSIRNSWSNFGNFPGSKNQSSLVFTVPPSPCQIWHCYESCFHLPSPLAPTLLQNNSKKEIILFYSKKANTPTVKSRVSDINSHEVRSQRNEDTPSVSSWVLHFNPFWVIHSHALTGNSGGTEAGLNSCFPSGISFPVSGSVFFIK